MNSPDQLEESGRLLRAELATILPKLTDKQLRELDKEFGYHIHELRHLSHKYGNEVAALLIRSLQIASAASIEIYVQDMKRRRENGTLFKGDEP